MRASEFIFENRVYDTIIQNKNKITIKLNTHHIEQQAARVVTWPTINYILNKIYRKKKDILLLDNNQLFWVYSCQANNGAGAALGMSKHFSDIPDKLIVQLNTVLGQEPHMQGETIVFKVD